MEIGDNTEEPNADDQLRADEAERLANEHTPTNNRDDRYHWPCSLPLYFLEPAL